MRKARTALGAAILILTGGLSVLADSWALPVPRKYHSENRRYYIMVIPRKLKSQLSYFEDKVAKKEPAGSGQSLEDNYCKGIFYRQNESGAYKKVWEGRLSNDVAPVNVLVSNSGEYVVTFDNWHSVGYGDNVVAIYGRDGKLIKKMGLSDFAPPGIEFPRSVSSIWWGGKHYIDEKRARLVLKVATSGSRTSGEQQYRDVHVDLKTGELVKTSEAAE